MNTFGRNLRLTTFGESHGPAMGGVIDGFPSGFKIDFDALQREIDKRRPGSSSLVTARNESDRPEFLSGISPDGITLGTPIGFIIRNSDHRSGDYDEMARLYRPNHADYTYIKRYGIRDHRGGGRASARETVNWVVAGALAQQWLNSRGINVEALLVQAGKVDFSENIKTRLTHCEPGSLPLALDDSEKKSIEDEIMRTKKDGDSIGGSVICAVTGVPAGVGNPVFGKLHAALASAMMTINAAKGFEYGLGMESAFSSGSDVADIFVDGDYNEKGYYAPGNFGQEALRTQTNYSGGMQGGISNGMPIYFRVFFKPTPTLMKPLPTVDTDGNMTMMKPAGRHDPCVAVRAVPVVRAMAALVIADFLL